MKCKVEGVSSKRLEKYLNEMPVDDEWLAFEVTGSVDVGAGESTVCGLCGDKIYNDESAVLGVCTGCRKGAEFIQEEGFFLVPVILFATSERVGVLLTHRADMGTIAPLNYLRQAVESDEVVFLQFLNEEAPYDIDKDDTTWISLDKQYQDEELAGRLARMRFDVPMPYAKQHLPEVMEWIRSGRSGQERALERLHELEQLDPLFAGYDVLIARTMESLGNNDGAVKTLVGIWERAVLENPAVFVSEFVRYDWHPAALRIVPSMEKYVERIQNRNRLLIDTFTSLSQGNLVTYANKRIKYNEELLNTEHTTGLWCTLGTVQDLHCQDNYKKLTLLADDIAADLAEYDDDEYALHLGQAFRSYANAPESFSLSTWNDYKIGSRGDDLYDRLMIALLDEDFSAASSVRYEKPDLDIPEEWSSDYVIDPVHWEIGSGEHRLVHRTARLFAQWRDGQIGESACRSRLLELDEEYDINLLASDNESYFWIYTLLKAEMLIHENRAQDVSRLFEAANRIVGKRVASQFYPYHFCAEALVQFYEAWAYGSLSGMEAALDLLPDDKPFRWLRLLYNEVAEKVKEEVSKIGLEEMQAELQRVIERMEEMLDEEIGQKVRDEFAAQIATIRERLEEKELRLALGGETSSGKTTFLNNIFETELFFVTPEEATGIPTEIRRGDSVRIEVFYASNTLLNTLDLGSSGNENTTMNHIEQAREFVEHYTKVGSTESASLVRVYLPVDGLDDDLVIIDTPGFNAHQARTGIAEEVIRHSHACVFLIDARNALKAGEMKVIEATRSEVAKTFFVLNKMDLVVGDNELDVDDDPADELKRRVADTLREQFSVDEVVVYAVSSIPTSDLPQDLQAAAAPYRDQLLRLRDNLFRETYAQRVHYLADAAAKEAIRVVEANRQIMEKLTESHHETARKLQEAIPTDPQLFMDEIYLRLDQTFSEARNRYNQELGQLFEREFPNAIYAYVDFLNSVGSKGDLKEKAQPKAKKITESLGSSVESGVRREQKRLSDAVLKELNRILTQLYEELPFKVKTQSKHQQTGVLKLDGSSIISDDSTGLDSGEWGMAGGALLGALVGTLILGPIGTALGGWLGGAISGKSIVTMKEELLEQYQSGLSDSCDRVIEQLNQQMVLSDNSSLNELIRKELDRLQEIVQKEIEEKSKEWDSLFDVLLRKKQQQMEVLVAAEHLSALRLEHQRASLVA